MTRTVEDPIQLLEQGFEMDGWRVLPHGNALERPGMGVRVRVSSKAMQVLVALAARAGEFVSKDELLATVWAGRVVTEDVLTGAVRILRRALEDDARNPHLIQTRKGSGYRLIVEVRALVDPRPLHRRPGWRWAAAIAVAGILISGPLAYRQLVPDDPATIAVLPFDGLSGAARDTYLASAMTDALILNLAERDRFRVISRTSVLPYAEQRKSLPLIARELRADYLVEGSVLTSEKGLRITAQLVDARDDTHLWGARYDRAMDDILAIQSDVANQIAHHIVGAVAESPEPLVREPALRGAALEKLLKARYLLAQERAIPVREAYELFHQLARDYPELADGHLGMAQAQLQLFKGYLLGTEALSEAAASVQRALELDPDRTEAFRCLGQIVQFKDWNFLRAEAFYRRAIELNPSDTVARRRYAWLLVALQRYDDALKQIKHIRLLDPHYYASADGALLLLFSGQHDRAVAELERLKREAPASARTLRVLSTAYWAVGRYDESAAMLIESRIAAGNSAEELQAAFEAEGRAGVYRYLLSAGAFRAPVSKAALHAQIGDYETALGWLERAVAERDPDVLFVLDRPELIALHDHPRFQALVQQVNPSY